MGRKFGHMLPRVASNYLHKHQNATIRLIYDVPYCVRNYHLYNDINFPKLSTSIQHLNVNFHLSFENSDNSALDTLPVYDIFDPINRKRRKLGIIVETLL